NEKVIPEVAMKQQIKIMKHRQQLPDEEIQGYMNFERLLDNRKSALQQSSMVTVAKWSLTVLLAIGLTFTLWYVSNRESSTVSSDEVAGDNKPSKNNDLVLSDSSEI